MAKASLKERMKKSFRQLLDKSSFRQWTLGFIVLLGLFLIMAVNFLPQGVTLEVGQVSNRDIQAPKTIVHRPQTERLQDEAAKNAVREASLDPKNFDINQVILIRAEERLHGFFLAVERARVVDRQESIDYPVEALRRDLLSSLGLALSERSLQGLKHASEAQYDLFQIEAARSILGLMDERISEEELSAVHGKLPFLAQGAGLSSLLHQVFVELGEQLITANLVLNTEKVTQARNAAIRQVEPILILKGEVILRRGDVVRNDHILILQDLGLQRMGIDFLPILGLLLVTLLLLLGLATYIYQYRPDIFRQESKLALLCVVLLVVSFIVKLLALIQWPQAALLSPVALASILLAILLDSRVALIATLILAFVASLVNDYDLVIFFATLVGGFTGVFSVSRVSQRGDLMRAGFLVGGMTFASLLTSGILLGELSVIVHSYLGILNGLLASIIAIGSLPFLESIFGITSAIRLLELSNPNHPLLRRLLMETPGTYHHSIVVGNLAEAAAEAVGADGLLARVGSNFHDIGKLKRPYFFVENQMGMENPHDKTTPSLSTLIIISHVKDGVELAREYKLPEIVVDLVAQHHGMDLVKYFFHKAKEQNGDAVEEQDFRYSGPKPQTKESAIVSLADAVEAAVRSLTKPTPGKIETLIYRIIKDRLDDGQLDECDLTFKDLNKINKAFCKVLIGVFHARVEYPERITREDIEGKKKP